MYNSGVELRIIVAAYLVFFFSTIVFLVKKVGAKTGASPIIRHSHSENPLMAFTERAVGLSYLLLIICAIFFVFDFAPFFLFDEFALPYKNELRIAGVVFAGAALGLIFTAQIQMRDSWRVGIDDTGNTEMVTRGLFGFFRHPIYLFAVVAGFSVFLIDPHSVSLVSFAAVYLALSFQARMEEEFMLRKWGERYRGFMRSRGRWF